MNFISKMLTFMWFSLSTATLQDQIKAIKSTGLTTICSQTDHGTVELLSTSAFLSRHNGTALFSPLCFDINLYSQMYGGEFKYESKDIAENRLNAIYQSVAALENDKLLIANNIYLPGNKTKTISYAESLINYEIYNPVDSEKVYKKHVGWVKKETKGLISSPLKKQNFEGDSRIYCSIVYFRDFWKKPFKINNTKVSIFTLRNGKQVERKYMNSFKSFKYRYIKSKFGDFEIVAIPYEDEIRRFYYKRYMVYLIPKDTKTTTENLWEAFNSECKTGISEMINDLDWENLNLSIPKIEELTSELNMCDIFPEIFEFNKALYIESKMKTYLQVDEEGTKAAALMSTTCTDGPGPIYIPVKAEIPHIAFGIDITMKTIIFVLKDEGPKKN